MQRSRWLTMTCLVLIVSCLGLNTACAKAETENQEFKVVGYYSEEPFDEPVARLQMDKLTHIMYAFLIPLNDGTLVPLKKPEKLKEIVAEAHQSGVEVYISIGGWSYQNVALASTFDILAESEASRANFIKNVLAFVQDYQLDGVELDWEYPAPDATQRYENLVVDLGDALHQADKGISAALSPAWTVDENGSEVSKRVSAKCLETFDFINVMAYDLNETEHSPLWFADVSVGYWLFRGLPPEKIVLGLPLYAHPSWLQYRDLVAADQENAYRDFVSAGTVSTLDSYYNGLNILKEKTAIALRRAGGVMFFDINEDIDGQYSALSMVDQTIKEAQAVGREAFAQRVLLFINNRPLELMPEDKSGDAFIDENGRTMIPLRKPLETLGVQVSFDKESGQITAVRDQITVIVTIGKRQITVNGQAAELDTQAMVKDGRAYIPARAVFEAFGAQVDWHDLSQSVYLTEQSSF